MKLKIINETLIEYNFSNKISISTSEEILKIAYYLSTHLDHQALGLIKITPSFTSIAIEFKTTSPLFDKPDHLHSEIIKGENSTEKRSYHTHYIETIYNGEDINDLCYTLALTKEQLIQLHQNITYSVAMLGFKGDFPYLLGLDKHLILPRRSSPRNCVKKGSIAIGSQQCGIYTQDSPGGWHIIAHTEFNNFKQIQAGDKVIFLEKKGKIC